MAKKKNNKTANNENKILKCTSKSKTYKRMQYLQSTIFSGIIVMLKFDRVQPLLGSSNHKSFYAGFTCHK